jgi:outer membrane immunogenic protein
MVRTGFAAAGAALIIFSVGQAQAADLRGPVDYGDRYADPAWAGGYVGVHGGGGWMGANAISGAVAGAQAGYNWQRGSFVYGGEIDASWTSHEVSLSGWAYGGSTYDAKVGLDGLISLRAMMGYANGPFLTYVTGGLSMGVLSIDVKSAGPHGNDQTDNSLVGGTFGLGFGWKLNESTALRAEANYHALSGDIEIYGEKTTVDTDLVVARALLDFRF